MTISKSGSRVSKKSKTPTRKEDPKKTARAERKLARSAAKTEKKQARAARKLEKQRAKAKRQTVEERREEVLAKGRKFKYPLQYAKYKVVWYTIIVAVVGVGLLTLAGWFSIYQAGSTSDMTYRITQILPIPVAEVDGQAVRFSDYLMLYKSSLSAVEQQSGALGSGEDAEALRSSYKRAALDSAEEYAYAEKLAGELGISVSDEEINDYLTAQRQAQGTEQTEEAFLKIVEDNLGLSEGEYRHLLYFTILKNKVRQAVDQNAAALAEQAESLLVANDNDLTKVAEILGDAVQYEETGGLVDDTNLDGGRAQVAAELEEGEVSAVFTSSSGDGLYLVQLISKTDDQVDYRSIKINFTTFADELAALREAGAVREYVTIE